MSSVEHPSVRRSVEFMRQQGWTVDVLSVNRQGEIDLNQFNQLLSERTALVTVMLANNETGHLFPLREITRCAHAVGALVHCDAIQAIGKIPVRLNELGVDMASFSAHKFYALKGGGGLYVRKGLNLINLVHGGGQERGRRGGTENVLAIASMGVMAKKRAEIGPQAQRMALLRDEMEAMIQKEIPGVRINGAKAPRLPNTSSLLLENIDGDTLVMALDTRGFALSAGSACSSGSPEPSVALLNMGLSRTEALSSLRVSLGWQTKTQELVAFVEALGDVVARLRRLHIMESCVHDGL